MIVLKVSPSLSKMIILLLLTTAVSQSIQAAVPAKREFSFLLDSPSVTELQPDYNDYDESSTPTPAPEFTETVNTTTVLSAQPTTLSADSTTLSAELTTFPADHASTEAEIGGTEMDSNDSTPIPVQNEETTKVMLDDKSEDDSALLVTTTQHTSDDSTTKSTLTITTSIASQMSLEEDITTTRTEEASSEEITTEAHSKIVKTDEEKDLWDLWSTTEKAKKALTTTEKMADTTLDTTLAFKEKEPKIENDETTIAVTEENIDSIFTTDGNAWSTFDSSLYDSFDDNDFTLSKNSDSVESETTTYVDKTRLDNIIFTKDGIEPLDDSAFVLTNTHLMAALNDDAVLFTTDRLPPLIADDLSTDKVEASEKVDVSAAVGVKIPQVVMHKIIPDEVPNDDSDHMVDGFIISSNNPTKPDQTQKTEESVDYLTYDTDDYLLQKALADYDFTLTNNEDVTTTESPTENEVDSDAIVDVIKNFIAEQDPILELFLSVCFVHPDCFQLESPLPHTELGAQGRQILHLLQARRSETARITLLTKIQEILVKIKHDMFEIMGDEVGKRGVSISATKNIIDSIKNAWEDVRDDLQYTISSLHEIFSSDVLLQNQDMYTGIAQIADTLHKIPDHVRKLYRDAAQNGYTRYQQFSAWNSWKKTTPSDQ